MEMTVILSLVAMVMSIASIAITYRLRRRRKQQERKLITVPMIKINFNPTSVQWEWSRLNPKTRTWEWLGLNATPVECGRFMDVMFTEEDGLKLLSDRLHEMEVTQEEKENDNG